MADDPRVHPPLDNEKAAFLRKVLAEPPEVQALFVLLARALIAAREREGAK